MTILSYNRTFYWAIYRVFDWIVTNYILTNCLKIQQNFLKYYKLYWINSEGYNLNFTVFNNIQMTVRHSFLFCGIFESIFDCIIYHIKDKVSSAKSWQCCDITIVRGEQFQIQEVLGRIGFFGLLSMSRTVSNRQSVKHCPPNWFLPGQVHILYQHWAPLHYCILSRSNYFIYYETL